MQWPMARSFTSRDVQEPPNSWGCLLWTQQPGTLHSHRMYRAVSVGNETAGGVGVGVSPVSDNFPLHARILLSFSEI